MVSLRIGLELGLLSVYWNLNDDSHLIVQSWLRSTKNTPSFANIWSKLIKHNNFKTFQERFDLHKRLLKMGYLHDYVHIKGYFYSNAFGLKKPNFQSFEEKEFKRWFDSFEEVVKILIICHLIKYPLGTIRFPYDKKFGIDTPSFGGLNEGQIDRLSEIIDRDIFTIICNIALNDKHVLGIIDWVTNLPDLTEEEVEEQVIEFDKSHIERMELEQWLKTQKTFIKFEKDPQKREKWKRRIEYLSK